MFHPERENNDWQFWDFSSNIIYLCKVAGNAFNCLIIILHQKIWHQGQVTLLYIAQHTLFYALYIKSETWQEKDGKLRYFKIKKLPSRILTEKVDNFEFVATHGVLSLLGLIHIKLQNSEILSKHFGWVCLQNQKAE